MRSPVSPSVPMPTRRSPHPDPDTFVEAVFFAYGVVVFFGLDEAQERSILEDVETAEIMQKPLPEARWEIEECHYEVSSLLVMWRIRTQRALVQTIHSLPSYLQRLFQ